MAVLAASLLVAACGGSGGSADTTPAVNINSVKVFGDSLQDSGTFGLKFTVQGVDAKIYVERVAAAYGQTLCNFFSFNGATFVPKPGCTNFAIGGGVVQYNGAGGAANPLTIGTQMATYASLAGYTANDLVIIDGGGNDAADLTGAFLAIPADKAVSYQKFLSTLLTPAQIGAGLAGGQTTTGGLGVAYMTALADKFYAQIKASVLDKGAQYVVVMNAPDITLTPRFQNVLAGVALANGGGTAGATARAQVQGLVQAWVKAYNAELAAKIGTDSHVIVIDFYQAFTDQVATPGQFGLTNATTPACPATGKDANGLPSYDFTKCVGATLSANPPQGQSGPDWWKSYAFSDHFHPTPYGHQLTQQLIAKNLAARGWL
jgi:phospholipase/lecithinase/hemolysin